MKDKNGNYVFPLSPKEIEEIARDATERYMRIITSEGSTKEALLKDAKKRFEEELK